MPVVANADSGAFQHYGAKRRRANTAIAFTGTQGSVATHAISDANPTPDIKDAQRIFNTVYSKWPRSEPVDEEGMTAITSVYVTEEFFFEAY